MPYSNSEKMRSVCFAEVFLLKTSQLGATINYISSYLLCTGGCRYENETNG